MKIHKVRPPKAAVGMIEHAQMTRAGSAVSPAARKIPVAPRKSDNVKARQILVAARKVFMDHGYGEASMDAIAREASVSKATLYAHFDDKAALFAALIVMECRHLSDQIGRGALDEPDIRVALLQIARDFNNLLCTGDGLTMYRIVVADAPRFPELGRIFYDSGPKVMIDRIAKVLRRAADRGLLKLHDPRMAAIQFISLIRGELHLTRILGLKSASKRPNEYVEASVDLFLAGCGTGKKRR
jgi:TetR/AcrR family transcriptional regulator, mexJK operon transcriptional repressor